MAHNPYSLESMTAALAAAQLKAEELEAANAPLVAKRDELRERILPLESELRDLNDQVMEANAPLVELKRTISSLTKAVGGKRVRTMSAESADIATEASE